MAKEEQVLVIEREVLEKAGLFHGVMLDVDRYLSAIFAPGVLRFMPRSLAEDDPTFKQLIPYVILSSNGRFLSYVRGRRAGEKRLVGLRSIGVGGHINPVDDMPLFSNDDFRDAYQTAVMREVEEEIDVGAAYTDSIVALLNDDTNEVGKVHLGVVHIWELSAPTVEKREQMITQMDFMSQSELQEVRDTLETWSALCLDSLTEMIDQARARPGETRFGVSIEVN